MNFDGRTDILDWFMIVSNHENAAGLNLQALLDGEFVPEPPTLLLIALSVAICGIRFCAWA
jgi:hypothetical protein